MPLTVTLTEAEIATASGAPTPFTYLGWREGSALTPVGGVYHTLSNGWTCSSAANGADLDITVDITAAPNDVGLPGLPMVQFPRAYLEYRDNAGRLRWHWVDRVVDPIYLGPPNQPPVAVDDADTTEQDTPVTVSVLSNDSDPDGDTLTVTGATVPAAQGTVVINPDGTLTFTPAAGFTGTATITYTIDDGNGDTDTADVVITVTPSIGDVYYEARGLVAGEPFNWAIGSPEGNVTVKRADGTIVGTGASGTLTVPAIDSGETYFIVDDTTIASTWNMPNANDASHAAGEIHIVNGLISSLFYRNANNLKAIVLPAQAYPNFSQVNHSGGALLERLEMQGTYANGGIRINAVMDPAATQYVHLPDDAAVTGNIGQLNVRNLDVADAAYFNWRAAASGGNVVGNTLVDLPTGNTYNRGISFIASTGTGFSMEVSAFATVASNAATAAINFTGTLPGSSSPAGWDYTDDSNIYHIGYWLNQLVAAGRDASAQYGLLTELGDWAGDPNGYGTTRIYTAAAQASADALAGAALPNPPTKWRSPSLGEFRM